MDDLKSLLLGVIGGLIVLGIVKIYRAYKRSSLKTDIEFIEFEKKHLEAMKKSSVEMNRSSFRAIFLVFILIGLANLIPAFIEFVQIDDLSTRFPKLINAFIWATAIGICFKFHSRYDNLKNYNAALEKFDRKLEKLNEKLGKS